MSTTHEEWSQLEDSLVAEFRLLQSLTRVTRQESSALLNGQYSVLMPIIEDIETMLDQLNRLEALRQKLADSLGSAMGFSATPVSIKTLLPCMEKEQAARIRRLCDGIITLSEQDKALNLSINTMSQSWIDMIHSTQAYLLSFYQPPATYQPPGGKPSEKDLAPVWATEHRA